LKIATQVENRPPGQLDLELLHVLELQATANVKNNADARRDVRFLPFRKTEEAVKVLKLKEKMHE
jgi:hypothetical protein